MPTARKWQLKCSATNSAHSVLIRAERRSEKKIWEGTLWGSFYSAQWEGLPHLHVALSTKSLQLCCLLWNQSLLYLIQLGFHLHNLIKNFLFFWWNSNLFSVPNFLILLVKFDLTDPPFLLETLPSISLAQYFSGLCPHRGYLLSLLLHKEGWCPKSNPRHNPLDRLIASACSIHPDSCFLSFL